MKAFIVANGSIPQEGLRAALSRWLAKTMPPVERPVDFRFGAQLPRKALGKLADWSSAPGCCII